MKKQFIVLVSTACVALAAQPAWADGKDLYEEHCRMCHGPAGEGMEKIAAMRKVEVARLRLRDMALTAESVARMIKEGAGRMKPVLELKGDADIEAVAKYVLTLKASKQ